MVRAGAGIGVLPCFVGHGLTRVLPAHVRLTRRFWLSVHKDVAETARVRAVRTWLRSLVKARRRDLLPTRERA
jgi:DNA-binding transcriptional LysR family regulator